tara:strand:- start:59 stop:1036 length:978 start_codon:yes stop_codon:yes gene_type:complete
MKLIFFAFKHRYRYKDLNNFLQTRFYNKYLILNLGGPFKHVLAKILIWLNIGYAISCDARPLIKKKGINFFIRGTNLNIPTNFRKLKNNYVSIINPFKKEKNIFQIYPINLIQAKLNIDPKIIFVSSINIDTNDEQRKLWNRQKDKILNDFTIIDKKSFWQNYLSKKNLEELFIYYRKFKLLIRYEVIKHISKKFKERLILIGDDWQKYSINALPSNYDYKYLKKLYKGNICLDLGSVEGSSSFYPRSNQIIESGGLILQNKQSDFQKEWESLKNKLLFSNLKNLDNQLNFMLDNKNFSDNLLQQLFKNFSKSKKLIEKNLDRIF